MGRALVGLALCATVLSAVGLYFLKYDTRQLSYRSQELERQIETTKSDISLLRAEVGALTHPERIERLAKERLGLKPMRPDQVRQMAGQNVPRTAGTR